MSKPLVTVAIPTLTAGPKLAECLAALEKQKFDDFDVCVIDNSGWQAAREAAARWRGVEVIENRENVGFGAAVNQACRRSSARFLATLNDDTVPDPGWLAGLVQALEMYPEAGMCASQVRLAGGTLDSAGMLISSDATSKQRGHGQAPEKYAAAAEVLLPSGCAALYRRKMLDEVGLFDEAFFLYCEDTDLGLRGRWAGWTCRYAPEAVVEHRYSQTAGAVSQLKAYFVERNRLFVLIKDFPPGLVARSPAAAAARYFWHLLSAMSGETSAAARYRENASVLELGYVAARAHAVLVKHARRLLRQRREIQRRARVTAREFEDLLARHFISPREVALL
ncbi:MAG TPA: glycosyltransferase family 2 protein [Bryobacteraceae bacterium]|nr:glycosyltransferase family 2 protein [Bryobacteraceae bacterium]